jgi:hypothetical protein
MADLRDGEGDGVGEGCDEEEPTGEGLHAECPQHPFEDEQVPQEYAV